MAEVSDPLATANNNPIETIRAYRTFQDTDWVTQIALEAQEQIGLNDKFSDPTGISVDIVDPMEADIIARKVTNIAGFSMNQALERARDRIGGDLFEPVPVKTRGLYIREDRTPSGLRIVSLMLAFKSPQTLMEHVVIKAAVDEAAGKELSWQHSHKPAIRVAAVRRGVTKYSQLKHMETHIPKELELDPAVVRSDPLTKY